MPVQRLVQRARNFIVDGVLGIHDTPHRIALGVAVAVFIAWTPTIGFQMALTIFFCTLLRANKVVGLPFSWITNPATLWIYVPSYVLGCRILGEPADVSHLTTALARVFVFEGTVVERFVALRDMLWAFLGPLWIGSVIIGLAIGGLSYLVVFRAVVAYRRRRAAGEWPPAAPDTLLRGSVPETGEGEAGPVGAPGAAKRVEAPRCL